MEAGSNQGFYGGHKDRALLFGVITTGLALIPTGYVAYRSNSIVLFGDLLRALVEFFAIFVSWLVFRKVERNDRTFFDYGLSKFEQVAKFVVGTAMVMAALLVTIAAAQRFFSPTRIEGAALGFFFAVLSVLGNIGAWFYYRHLSRSSESAIFEAQWRLFRTKAAASFIVVLSVGLALGGFAPEVAMISDPIGSLFLGAFLLYSASGLVSGSLHELLDRSLEEGDRLTVLRTLVANEALYSGLRGIRTRKSGKKRLVEIFLEFQGSVTMAEVSRRVKILVSDLSRELEKVEVIVIPLTKEMGTPPLGH